MQALTQEYQRGPTEIDYIRLLQDLKSVKPVKEISQEAKRIFEKSAGWLKKN